MKNKKVLIIGAGPAGLTAGYDFLKKDKDNIDVIIIEKSKDFGGISKTVDFKGNKIDIGGHRFFSKSDKVMDFWASILPVQTFGKESIEIAYQNKKKSIHSVFDINPDITDSVMLVRNRLSRIFYLKKFFKYPMSLSLETLKNLGLIRMVRIGFSYIWAISFPIKPEKNLEDFFINRFGKELYRTFFKDYTEKVWGEKCTDIPADWGAQRIKGLSIYTAVKNIFFSVFSSSKSIAQKDKETSLIERFLYPKFGPGQMWQEVARHVVDMGGDILKETTISKIHLKDGVVVGATIVVQGVLKEVECDYIISTMPITELVPILDISIPQEVERISSGLKYRDFLTVGVLLKKMSSQIAPNGIAPDNWIYIQEPYVKVGRIQIFNNWSPYLVKDPLTVWIGMEYFANVGDDLWSKSDEELKKIGEKELLEMSLIEKGDVIDMTVLRMEKAYPAYFGTYKQFDVLRNFLDGIDGLFLVGRNGMHRYNNQDHSMLTAMEAVTQIISGKIDKTKIWNINTEQEYHEKK
ncbi:MAG: NAD(P)/FAD-dependent oxidoreductase [Minisyncoccota bacterium]